MATFGQIRRITFHLPQEKLYSNINSGVIYQVDYNQADIEFKIECISGAYTNVCSFKIYGVSRETYTNLNAYMEKDKEIPVQVLAGYESNKFYSDIFTGKISKIDYIFNDGDPYLECILDENSDRMYFKYFEKAYAKNTRRSYIINDIILDSGYIPKIVDIPEEFDTIYRRGYTAKGSPKEVLDKIANDTNMTYSFDDKYVSVFPKWLNKESEVIPLDYESGLISTPKKGLDNLYTFKMFLNHKIKSDTLIMIITDNFGRVLPAYERKGIMNHFKVNKYTHDAGDENLFETTVECQLSSPTETQAKNLWEQLYKKIGGKFSE